MGKSVALLAAIMNPEYFNSRKNADTKKLPSSSTTTTVLHFCSLGANAYTPQKRYWGIRCNRT